MQYTQEDHLNLFLNEELNQQIKALLVNIYLQPLSKNLEDVRGKLNGPMEGVCNESRKFAESLSELLIKTLRIPAAPLPPGQFPKKYAALGEMIDSIQFHLRDHQNTVTREAARKLVHYLKVIGFAGNAASHREGPVPVSKYDKICAVSAVLECARVVSLLVNANTVPQSQPQGQYGHPVVPALPHSQSFVQSQQGYGQQSQTSPRGQAASGAESNVLLISNLAPGLDENLLAASILSIVDVVVVKCSVKEKNGFRRAFLHLKDASSAKLARDALDGKKREMDGLTLFPNIAIKGQKIKVALHVPKPKAAPLVQSQAQFGQPQPVHFVGSQMSQPQFNMQPQPVFGQPQQPFGGVPTLVLSKQERDVFSLKFRQIDPFGTGKVAGGTARPLFEAFGLSYTDLAQIWDIADKDKDGNLTEDEFVTAMALLSAKKSGKIQQISSNYNIVVN